MAKTLWCSTKKRGRLSQATLKGHTKKVTSVVYHPNEVIIERDVNLLWVITIKVLLAGSGWPGRRALPLLSGGHLLAGYPQPSYWTWPVIIHLFWRFALQPVPMRLFVSGQSVILRSPSVMHWNLMNVSSSIDQLLLNVHHTVIYTHLYHCM